MLAHVCEELKERGVPLELHIVGVPDLACSTHTLHVKLHLFLHVQSWAPLLYQKQLIWWGLNMDP